VNSLRTEQTVDVTMPQMGVSVAEGTIVGWRVQVGDRIEADATICDISTDKIDTEVPAPVGGVVTEILVAVDETVPVGTVLARIGAGGAAPLVAEAALEPESSPTTYAPAPTNGHGNGSGAPERPRGRYSPVVQRIAAEHDIDLATVTGTGRDGRVRKQDVLAAVAASAAPAVPEPPLHIESPYVPESASASAAADGGALSRMRRQIGEHMKRSLETAAHCTTWIEVDMGGVEAARAQLGLTALPFVAAAVNAALREHPALNATLDGEHYTRHHEINLGIAVSLGEDGLIVPVVRGAHELSVEGLSARIKELARRAWSRELTPDDVTGGTFTITNPGQYGSIMATPIINQPQVGILDFEATIKRAVVVTDATGSDAIAIRPMTILGLSWDHRALDGVQAAQFLASVKRHLETVA
jgi:pyruvate/2-oxoglutarate dehydrogenase complex dihydrolipoamide acyltransferase (E2) component